LFLESASVEETYRTLFDRVGTLGGEAFLAAMKERRRDLVAGTLAPRQENPAEQLVARVVQSLADKYVHSPAGQPADSSLTGVLGDASVRQLVSEYLEHIPSQQRRQLVQVSSMLQLIIQVRLHSSCRPYSL
jgi:hypothetical protein